MDELDLTLTSTLQSVLMQWAEQHRRVLPWRATRDPWAVLVSEVMLQQTQVPRVVGRYETFLLRFPTAAACATASAGDVVREWAGLGYNRRALLLHRCATEVVARYGGAFPQDLDALLALPGIGPYTARAVSAFAFARDVGVVDTNAARILARAVAGRALRAREAQSLADALVPAGEGWAWNQAMLDLGATHCTSRSPSCGACPVAEQCAWSRARRHDPATSDPAVGSAGVSGRQSRFAGSDRQGRGRLIAALRAGPISSTPVDVAVACGWPGDETRAARTLDGLVAEGLVCVGVDGLLRLP